MERERVLLERRREKDDEPTGVLFMEELVSEDKFCRAMPCMGTSNSR